MDTNNYLFMKRASLLLFLLISSFGIFAQNMSYTCPKDTTLGCNTNCFTIVGKIPDIRSSSSQYMLGNISDVVAPCIPNPNLNGIEAFLNIIDDTYSAPLPIGFSFPFYGTNYTNLVASTNGYLSFDVSRSGLFSTWSLSAGNVPNTSYDGALIMGPWHDLDPAYTTSPVPQGQQMKYSTVGAAPNRQWALNFYRVPLFSTTCQGLFENTHRIVLHESTGLIEIFIFDKQQCPTWNSGKAMVGIQNMTKTQGMMAPGRAATDAPWGSIGMNEVWRFVPAAGPTLYRSVELLDGTGTSIAIGDTTRLDAMNFQVSFPNVCPPLNSSTSLYVIKTTYQKIDDPTTTIYSLDTVNVIRQAQLPVTASMTPTTCGQNTGTVTVNASGTPGYTYTLDGGTAQSTPVFTGVSVGTHNVFAQDATGCSNTTTVNVTAISSLPFTSSQTNCSCPGRTDGTITVTPTLGTAPFIFTITGTGTLPGPITSNTSATFTNLSAGTYTVTFTDALGCSGTTAAIVITAGTAITSTYTSTLSCPSISNGSVTVTPTSGTGPYTITMAGYTGTPPPPGASATFTGLAGATFGISYTVTITDASGCTGTKTVWVDNGTGITGTSTTTPATCSTVSNGTITVTPTSGLSPYTFSIDGGPYVSSTTPPSITFTGLATGSHTITIKDATGCTGTVVKTVTAGTGVTATAASTQASCSAVSNGTISVTTTNGTAPFTYSLDAGAYQPPFSPTVTFNAVAGGSHTVTVKDVNGCTGTVTLTVGTGAGLVVAPATSTPTSCPSVLNGTITITAPTNGVSPYTYTLGTTGIVQTSSNPTYTFTNVSNGAYVILVTDNIGCTGNGIALVGAGPGLTSTTTITAPNCSNINDGAFTINPSVAGSYTFTLYPGTAQEINQPTPTFSSLGAGTYPYSLTSTTSGCSGTGSVTLTTNTPITTTVSLTMPLCNGGNNGIITLNPNGGVPNYQFSIDAGVTYQNIGIFNTIAAGTHTIRIKDSYGCLKDTTVTMSEPTLLTLSATSNPGTCNGNDGQIIFTANGGTPAYTYSVDNGATYQNTSTIIVSGGNYPNINVKDANGCIANTAIVVTLIDNMVINPINDTVVCFADSVKLIPNVSVEANVFNWRTIPDATLINTLSANNIKTPYAKPTDTTTYIVRANWGICFREDTITVNVLHKPIPDAGDNLVVCNYKRDTLLIGSVSNTSGTVNFNWTPANTCVTPNQPTTIANPDSTQTYTLTVTDNYGCNFSVTDNVVITVKAPLPSFAGNDTIAIKGVPHQLQASGGGIGASYIWEPTFPLDFPSATSPNRMATIYDDQLFTVHITDIDGCEGADSIFIRVYEGPTYYVPNAFSPNGDGLNDIFRAVPVGIATTEWFKIFNRNGLQVFQTNRWLQGWDGTYQGKKQPSGAYVWLIKGFDKDGKVVTQKGTVLLLN